MAGGSDAVSALDSKGARGPKAGWADGSIGEPAVLESGRPVSPSSRLSPDLSLSPGLKERVLEAARNVRPEAAR